jgi:manganese/zinc/iron transport system permease protein
MSDLLQIGILSAIAISCGLLGPFLVLRKMTMLANALSHTILLGIALAFLAVGGAFFDLSNLLIGAFLAALLTAFLTGGLVRFFRLAEDASIGLVFTALFALGITVVTLFTKEAHLGIEAVMGNADVLQASDLKLGCSLVGLNIAVISLFYKQFQLISFDQNLAKTLKISFTFFHFLLLFLVAITCVVAFRAVGALLVLAFLVGPFLTARLFSHSLPKLLVLTPLIGTFASIAGVGTSRFFLEKFGLPLSTAGIVATIIGLIFAICSMIKKVSECKSKSPS